MSSQERLAQEIKAAMLAKDAARLSTLRLLKSAVGYAQLERKTETLSEADFVAVVQKEVKKRRDSIEQFEKAAGRSWPKMRRRRSRFGELPAQSAVRRGTGAVGQSHDSRTWGDEQKGDGTSH